MARLIAQSEKWGKDGQLYFEIISINKTVRITVNDEGIHINANNIEVEKTAMNACDIIFK